MILYSQKHFLNCVLRVRILLVEALEEQFVSKLFNLLQIAKPYFYSTATSMESLLVGAFENAHNSQ